MAIKKVTGGASAEPVVTQAVTPATENPAPVENAGTESATPAGDAQVKTKKASSGVVDNFNVEGRKLREGLSEEQKALEGSLSDHIKRVITYGGEKFKGRTVLKALPDSMKKKEGSNVPQGTAQPGILGYGFIADVPVQITKLINDGYGGSKVVDVPANTEFRLTRNELPYFFCRPEMRLVCADSKLTFRESQNGVTPVLISTTDAAMKENMIVVDEKVGDVYVCKPEFEEDFGYLYKKRTGKTINTTSEVKDTEAAANISAGAFAYYSKVLAARAKK